MGIPPVPNTLIAGDLHEWVVARQKDLMNAWSSGQVDTVVELTKLVHDGATQMKELMSCETTAAWVSHDSQLQTPTFEGSGASKHHQKFHEKTPRER